MGTASGHSGPEAKPRQDWLSFGLAGVVHLCAALLLDTLAPESAYEPTEPSEAERIDALMEVDLDHAPGIAELAPSTLRGGSSGVAPYDSPSPEIRLPKEIPAPDDQPSGEAEPAPMQADGEPRSAGDGPAAGTPSRPGEGPAVSDGYGPPPIVGYSPGAGGPAIWSMPGVMPPGYAAPAPTTTPRRRYERDAAGRVLRAELRRRDAKLGILPAAASATASALRVAVRVHTPAISLGTFQARFGGSGQLLGLQVISFSAGTAQQWQRAVAQARAELATQKFTMRGDFASGALVTVNTRSVMQLPSGDGRKPVKPKAPLDPSRWPFLPESPPEGRSFRTPPWGPPPDEALARGDLSDIGARPRRVVYANASAQPL
jgi:hypothetical protein